MVYEINLKNKRLSWLYVHQFIVLSSKYKFLILQVVPQLYQNRKKSKIIIILPSKYLYYDYNIFKYCKHIKLYYNIINYVYRNYE